MGIRITVNDTYNLTLQELMDMFPNSKAAKEVKAKNEALVETQRLLRNGANGAIVDTVWSDSELNTTLYEKIYQLTGEAV